MGRRRQLDVAVDAVLAGVAATAGSLLELADPDPTGNTFGAPMAVRVAVQVLGAATLLARRRRPYTMAGTIAVLNLVVPVWATFLAPYAVFSPGAGGVRRAFLAVAALTTTFLVGMRAWEVADPFAAPLAIV